MYVRLITEFSDVVIAVKRAYVMGSALVISDFNDNVYEIVGMQYPTASLNTLYETGKNVFNSGTCSISTRNPLFA